MVKAVLVTKKLVKMLIISLFLFQREQSFLMPYLTKLYMTVVRKGLIILLPKVVRAELEISVLSLVPIKPPEGIHQVGLEMNFLFAWNFALLQMSVSLAFLMLVNLPSLIAYQLLGLR
jgi:hypothetical protein